MLRGIALLCLALCFAAVWADNETNTTEDDNATNATAAPATTTTPSPPEDDNATAAPTTTTTPSPTVSLTVSFTMQVSETDGFTKEAVGEHLKTGIAAAVAGLDTDMIEIESITSGAGTPSGNTTTTQAPTRLRRRLAAGEVSVVAKITGAPSTITVDSIESKATDGSIMSEINTALAGTSFTISSLTAAADVDSPTPSPTPAPMPSPTPAPMASPTPAPTTTKDGGVTDGAFAARLDLGAALVLVSLFYRGA